MWERAVFKNLIMMRPSDLNNSEAQALSAFVYLFNEHATTHGKRLNITNTIK